MAGRFPGMEDSLFSNQGKKLLMVGLFLWCVASLVGGEDNPGVLAEQVGKGQVDTAAGMAFEPEHATATAMQATTAPRQDDSDLNAWYAATPDPMEAAPQEPEPFVPQPVDESHLINDTKPFVSVAPEVR